MSLIIIEGARKSGKTHLINSQESFPIFKFDFNSAFTGLGLDQQSPITHSFGLGKEIMLQQLNRDGFLYDTFMIDRGILSNAVWGVLQKRITRDLAEKELEWAIDNGLLNDTRIFLILGTSAEERIKDQWDFADNMIEEEKELFLYFSNVLISKGVKVNLFKNFFDSDTLDRFKKILIG